MRSNLSDRKLLEVAVRHRVNGFMLDAEFSLTEPWTVLFGSSGAGKSTVLRAIAGLVRPDHGRIVCCEGNEFAVLNDSEKRVFVSPHLRRIRLVGQQTALFPHLTILENVSYGMGRGISSGEAMDLCRVNHLAERKPAMISGGERQRVALARALAAMPARLLLLDEPFAGLDGALRDEMMFQVQSWLGERGVPVLHVTHDVGEVFGLNAEAVLMEEGRVTAQGPAEVMLRLNRERLLARLGR